MARKSRKNLEATPAKAVKNPIFNVGAYVRLSVVDRKQKGDSIETQQAIINELISESPDLKLCETYIDNGLSGQTLERPAFQRMIADLECGKINCCITKDLSRLGRNAIDTGYYIEKFFPSKGIRFIAITDDYDSADGQSGNIMVSLKNMINETYAIEVGRKIRATHQMNIGSGRYVGNLPPYGYLKSKEDCHVLVPDEYAAPIVRQMFEMTIAGIGVRDILKWLTENEILTPSRYFHSKGLLVEKKISPHIHWSFQAVSTILRNRMYCGDMVQGKSKTTSYVSKKLPPSEWTVVENTHTPIVSRELFDKVQEIRTNNPRTKESKFGPATDNVFSGKIFCAHCGFTMLRKRYSQKAYGFVCNTARLYANGACTGANLSETVLKKTLLNMLSAQESKITEILSSVSQERQSENICNDELTAIQTELEKNRFYFKSLYENLIDGCITDTEYREMKAAYEAKIATLTEREKELRDTDKQRLKQENVLSSAQKSVCTLKHISDLTTEVTDKLIKRIEVFGDKHIEVKLTFSDEVLYGNWGENNE